MSSTVATAPLRLSEVSAHPRIGWRAIALLVLAYSISLGVLSSALRVQYGFPLDDSYIHQTVARNFAQYGVLGFIPGIPSSGATSVLWAFLQAANYRLVHADPVVFNLVISWSLLAVIGILLFTLAERDGLPRPYGFAFAVAPALCGNFIWLALIGMEHLLFVAIALACIYFWFDEQGAGSALLAGICAGLLALTRPEAVIFGPVLLIAGLTTKRKPKEIVSMLAAWIPLVVILFAVNDSTSHSLMPATLKGRSWLYFHHIGGSHSANALIDFLLSWLFRTRMQFSLHHVVNYGELLLSTIALAIACIGALSLARNRRSLSLLLLFATAHFGIFLVLFPSNGSSGRYQPLNLLLLFPCLYSGLIVLVRPLRRPGAVVATCAMLYLGIGSLAAWHTVTIDSIAHINNTHMRVAEWLLRNAPEGAKVAAFDIGRISYEWNHPVIDLGGLVDPSFVPYLQDGRVPAYVQQQHADYVILPSGSFASDLGFSDMQSFSKEAEFCSPLQLWQISVFFSGNAAQCQGVYRIRP